MRSSVSKGFDHIVNYNLSRDYCQKIQASCITIDYVTGYADGSDSPDKVLNLVPGAVKDAEFFLSQHPETFQRFEKVSSLVDGFESPFGLELLSTVHWVIKNEPIKNIEDVIESTYRWSSRKKQFSPRQIKLAVEVLAKKGWCAKVDQLTEPHVL